MSYRAKLRHLPVVVTALRRRAGHASKRSAVRAIREKTGHTLGHPCLSKWERGQEMPSVPSLVFFLDGLGYDLKVLQDELDRAAGEILPEPRPDAPPTAPPDGLARRLAELEDRLLTLEGSTSGGG